MGESVTECTGEGGKGLGEFELYGKVRQESVEESWESSGVGPLDPPPLLSLSLEKLRKRT